MTDMAFSALIVDDDREIQAQLRTILEGAGATVTSAYASIDGRREPDRSVFDLIVLRTDMPELNGVWIAEALRRERGPSAEAFVIGLSGDMTRGYVLKCHHAGMTRVLERPVITNKLLAALKDFGLVTPPKPATTATSVAVFAALSQPLRLKLIGVLTDGGPASASKLAREMEMSRQKLDFHLKALKEAGLVDASPHGREMQYSAQTGDLEAVAQWLIGFGRAAPT
jgi:CheY-like chemotaxis protein